MPSADEIWGFLVLRKAIPFKTIARQESAEFLQGEAHALAAYRITIALKMHPRHAMGTA